jgi:hypothetical protein
LRTFDLLQLQQYTQEKSYSPTASKDFHLFFVGRDDVHDILKYVLSRVSVSLYFNMFGYDDAELNDILMAKALDPSVTMLITLDKSQAGGKHEKALSTRTERMRWQIQHVLCDRSILHPPRSAIPKGFVADSKVGGEGPVN